MGHDPVLSLVSSLGPQGYRNARACLSQLRRGNSTRRQLGASHQKAWRPESPSPGQRLVTRSARDSALPKGDGKPERSSGKPTTLVAGGCTQLFGKGDKLAADDR